MVAKASSATRNAREPATGLRIFSLYGKTRRPTKESLQGINTLVFDIQDIGTRFYTYISTMGNAMRAAAERGISFVVLDRPNPIGGHIVAGGKMAVKDFHRLCGRGLDEPDADLVQVFR